MTIKEKIGNMAAWKVALILMVSVGCIVIGIEHYFVNKAFSFMNGMTSHLEQQFKEDDDDMEQGFKDFEEKEVYERADSKLTQFEGEIWDTFTHKTDQERYCLYLISNQTLKGMQELPYAKHHDYIRKSLTDSISRNMKKMEEGMKKGEFDPAKCKDSTA
jgi:hypothetical protein